MESGGDARHSHTREPRLGVARPMDRTRDAYQAGFLPAGKFVNGPWGVPQPGRIHPPSPRPVHHPPGHASPLPRKCEGASSNESRRRDVGRSTLYRKILIEGFETTVDRMVARGNSAKRISFLPLPPPGAIQFWKITTAISRRLNWSRLDSTRLDSKRWMWNRNALTQIHLRHPIPVEFRGQDGCGPTGL